MLGPKTSRLRRTIQWIAPLSSLLLVSDSLAHSLTVLLPHHLARAQSLAETPMHAKSPNKLQDQKSKRTRNTNRRLKRTEEANSQSTDPSIDKTIGAQPKTSEELERELAQAPRDPDATAFMPAPYRQLGRWSTPRQSPLTRGFSLDRRLQITVLPTFASLRLPFIARPLPIRGGGAALEIDVRLLRWLWLRAQMGHTVHPVQEEAQIDEEEKATILAKSGTISATHTGLSLVYAMDTGRVMPMIDLGLDAMWIRSPKAAQNGQMGGKCNKGNVCEIGLTCRERDKTCQPSVLGQVHAGIGIDYLIAMHWSVGLHVRYFARIQKPSEFPVYLLASARAAFRF